MRRRRHRPRREQLSGTASRTVLIGARGPLALTTGLSPVRVEGDGEELPEIATSKIMAFIKVSLARLPLSESEKLCIHLGAG